MAAGKVDRRKVETQDLAVIFATVTRLADALDFVVPGPEDMGKVAARLLAKGYAA